MNIPSYLISVEKKKMTSTQGRVQIFPFVFAFINILLCSYFDQYLQNDPDGYYLQLFLFVQASVGVLFAVGFYKQGIEEVLLKTQIFPVSSWNRFFYIVKCNLRRPLSMAWILTTALFFLVFYRQERVIAFAAILFFLLIILVIETAVAAVILLSKKSYYTVSGLGVLVVFLLFGILVSSIIFNYHAALIKIPVVSWATAGILAVQKSDITSAGVNALLFLLIPGIAIFTVKKFA